MQHRGSGLGRPSGTDGSDFSYRMVVDSRYQNVARGKSKLYVLVIVQAFIQIIGVLNAFLWTLPRKGLNMYAISSIAAGLISLITGELGRRHSRVSLLKVYMAASLIALYLSIVSVAQKNIIIQVFETSSYWDIEKFILIEIVRIILGLLIQVVAIRTTLVLIRNMCPPKRTS